MNFKKQFGQNFLRTDKFAKELIAPLELNEHSTVIEVGPGDGQVTNLLLATGAKVISIEVDYSLVPKLLQRFGPNSKFELVHQDIMQVDLAKLFAESGGDPQNYSVVGSLPYNISKQIIHKFLTHIHPPEKMSCIIQEEVAHEYVARSPKANFLSNWIRLYAQVQKLVSIPATQFIPTPKVNGAILVITPHKVRSESNTLESATKLLRIGFSQPRKTLWNNLTASKQWETTQLEVIWQEAGWDRNLRPAFLEPEEWLFLGTKLN